MNPLTFRVWQVALVVFGAVSVGYALYTTCKGLKKQLETVTSEKNKYQELKKIHNDYISKFSEYKELFDKSEKVLKSMIPENRHLLIFKEKSKIYNDFQGLQYLILSSKYKANTRGPLNEKEQHELDRLLLGIRCAKPEEEHQALSEHTIHEHHKSLVKMLFQIQDFFPSTFDPTTGKCRHTRMSKELRKAELRKVLKECDKSYQRLLDKSRTESQALSS